MAILSYIMLTIVTLYTAGGIMGWFLINFIWVCYLFTWWLIYGNYIFYDISTPGPATVVNSISSVQHLAKWKDYELMNTLLDELFVKYMYGLLDNSKRYCFKYKIHQFFQNILQSSSSVVIFITMMYLRWSITTMMYVGYVLRKDWGI